MPSAPAALGEHLFPGGAHDRPKLMDKAAYLKFVIEIIRRTNDQKGFQVLPRRWVVERTFGWMTDGAGSCAIKNSASMPPTP